MLEQRMISTAYPMLLRLMSEYGHSLIELKLEKAARTTSNPKLEYLDFEIRSDSTIRMTAGSFSSAQVNSGIGSKIKKCPILNFFTTTTYFIATSDMYIRYCSMVVAEIEKYKDLENQAGKVMDRLDAFNIPLTRFVLLEKTQR